MTAKNSHIEQVASSLKDVVNQLIEGKAGLSYTQDPETAEKPIVEYNSRLRLQGMEKFNAPCYIAAVQFYANEQKKNAHDALGVLVMYIERDLTLKLLKPCGYPVKMDDGEEVVLEKCGSLCVEIANGVISRIQSQSYGSLVLSDPILFENNIAGGLEFDYDEYTLYELVCYLWNEKALAFDISLAPSSKT